MSLINYKDIDFKKSINKENKIINFNGSEIQIIDYLSIHDKYDLIMITLQKSFENGIYNDLKLNMYFDLNIIYMYTNIVFNEEDRADEEGLYDTLQRSGLISVVKEQISKDELNFLWHLMGEIERKLKAHKGSILGFLSNVLGDLPEKATKAMDTLKQLDPEVLKSLSTNSLAGTINSLLGQTLINTTTTNINK